MLSIKIFHFNCGKHDILNLIYIVDQFPNSLSLWHQAVSWRGIKAKVVGGHGSNTLQENYLYNKLTQ